VSRRDDCHPIRQPRLAASGRIPLQIRHDSVYEPTGGNEVYSWETGMFGCGAGAGIDL
jgi:hypothetical protein